MAYVKMLHCRSADHVVKLERYATQSAKTENGKLIYYNELCDTNKSFLLNCNDTALHFNKTKQIRLCYQMIQSFKRTENYTPEQIFEVSKEFAESALPGYKYFVTTHVDADNIINSHIVFDGINSITGKRYEDNISSITAMRKISDEICRKYNLTTIEPTFKNRSIDKDTYELMNKGKSWKAELAADIDRLLSDSNGMNGFIADLKNLGYEVKVTPKNITVKKIGEKKGVRLDTLAGQFGDKYSKSSIENHFAGNEKEQLKKDVSDSDTSGKRYVKSAPFNEANTEFQKLQRQYFRNINHLSINQTRKPKSFLQYFFERRTIAGRIFRIAKTYSIPNRPTFSMQKEYNPPVQIQYGKLQKPLSREIGNMNYKMLMNSYGENCTLIISPDELKKLDKADFFYTGKVTENKIYITFKKFNSDLVAKALDKNAIDFKTHGELNNERFLKRELKAKAAERGESIYKMRLSRNEVVKLEQSDFDIAYTRYGKEYSVLCFDTDLEKICKTINRDYNEEINNKFVAEHKKNYVDLKNQATITNDKLLFRVIDNNGIEKLKSADFKFAVFKKEIGKYNCSFLESDLKKWNKIFERTTEQLLSDGKRNYAILKSLAAEQNIKLEYRVIDKEQLEKLKEAEFNVAVFEKKNESVSDSDTSEKYNCSFLESDLKEWNELMGNIKTITR